MVQRMAYSRTLDSEQLFYIIIKQINLCGSKVQSIGKNKALFETSK